MSGADRINYELRERLKSTDLNNQQSLKDRNLAETLKYQMAVRNGTPTGGAVADRVRTLVFGGLEAVPNGANIEIFPGVLYQNSNTLPPALTSVDSSYRYARNASALLVAMPAPGADTWYLLEAQMVEVVTDSDTRDIFNETTGVFDPTTIDVQLDRQIQTQLLTGTATSIPTPTGGDWVPIAAVYRPGGGGNISNNDIIDMRPLADSPLGLERPRDAVGFAGQRIITQNLKCASSPTAPSNLVQLLAVAETARGQVSCDFIGAFDVTAPQFKPAAVVLSPGDWFYLYLCRWSTQDVAPGAGQLASGGQRGLLVLSDTVTITGRLQAAATFDAPAPFDGVQIAPEQAVCVGVLRRNGANTGWLSTAINERRALIEEILPTNGSVASVGTNTAVHTPEITSTIPSCAVSTQLSANVQISALSANASYFDVEIVAGGAWRIGRHSVSSGGAASGGGYMVFEWPRVPIDSVGPITYRLNGAEIGTWSAAVNIIGFWM